MHMAVTQITLHVQDGLNKMFLRVVRKIYQPRAMLSKGKSTQSGTSWRRKLTGEVQRYRR